MVTSKSESVGFSWDPTDLRALSGSFAATLVTRASVPRQQSVRDPPRGPCTYRQSSGREDVQSALAPKAMSKPAPLRARPTKRMPAHSRT